MARSKTIRVTPNVQKCLRILQETTKSLPPGDLKTRSEGACKYLSRTFKGEPQPRRGRLCPPQRLIIVR